MDPYFSINGINPQSKGQEFQNIITELRQSANGLDEAFLLKLVQAL